MSEPSETSPGGPAEAAPPAPHAVPTPRRRRVLLLLVAVVAILAVGVGLAVSRSGGTSERDPRQTTIAYYGALAARKSADAYALLCAGRQQVQGESDYATAYQTDVTTGTGVASWSPGAQTVQGSNAAVPGTLVLDDHESVPITILVVHEADGWRVCTSDLGGVIPNPGTSGGGVNT